MSLNGAISSLKRGEFILLHDAGKRENEVDMVVAAEFVTPAHIARMRDRKSTRLNSSHIQKSRMPSSA